MLWPNEHCQTTKWHGYTVKSFPAAPKFYHRNKRNMFWLLDSLMHIPLLNL